MSVVILERVTKLYSKGSEEIRALDSVDLRIDPGDSLSIMGPSGSGKSTLLNVLGLLDRPTSGVYRQSDVDVMSLDDDELSRLRNRTIGFIFQSFNLFPQMSVVENIEVPMVYAGVPARERRRRAEEGASQVGLGHRLKHLPTELSGGEMQRVAIARALVGEPKLVLADEPTGNLDQENARQVLALLRGQVKAHGAAGILVTHSETAAATCDRRYRLTSTGLAPL